MSSIEELKNKIEERRRYLFRDEGIVQEMKGKAFYIPFMAMGFSLITLYIGKRLIASRPSIRRPVLFQFGMGLMGAMMGAQFGALWLQREYFKLDPEGKLLADFKEMGRELKELKESIDE